MYQLRADISGGIGGVDEDGGGGEGEGANDKGEGGVKEMEVVKMEKVKLVRMKQDVGVAEAKELSLVTEV
jgi:hypothetical protein